jgi:hypothetical protein
MRRVGAFRWRPERRVGGWSGSAAAVVGSSLGRVFGSSASSTCAASWSKAGCRSIGAAGLRGTVGEIGAMTGGAGGGSGGGRGASMRGSHPTSRSGK